MLHPFLLLLLAPAATLPGLEVRFRQIEWDVPGPGTIPYSRAAEVELLFDAQDTAFLAANGGAYVNVSVQNSATNGWQWCARNLYHSYANVEDLTGSSPSALFTIGAVDGTPFGPTGVKVSVTSVPMAVPPGTPATLQLPGHRKVAYFGHEVGTYGPGEGGGVPGPLGPFAGQSTPAAVTSSVMILIPFEDIPEVKEEEGGCWPGSVTRSIQYMAMVNSAWVPDAQSMYNCLSGDMGCSSSGCSTSEALSGKASYCDGLGFTPCAIGGGLPISTELHPGPEQPIDWDYLMLKLWEGCDIELILDPKSGNVGHVAMITCITEMDDGTHQITVVNDSTTDGKKEQFEVTFTVADDDVRHPSITPGNSYEVGGFVVETWQ